MQELYSVEQVANLLGLHVKTVRNYVRDGRLKAVRVGKQYRITRADIEAFAGGSLPAPARRTRHVEVSSIVEIDAISPEAADRVRNLLMGAANSRGAGHEPLRIETIYDAERARMKIILVGSIDTNASMFKLIRAVLEE